MSFDGGGERGEIKYTNVPTEAGITKGIKHSEVEVEKNYLKEYELIAINKIVTVYLDIAVTKFESKIEHMNHNI